MTLLTTYLQTLLTRIRQINYCHSFPQMYLKKVFRHKSNFSLIALPHPVPNRACKLLMTIVTQDLIQLWINRSFFLYTDQSLPSFSAKLSIVRFQSQKYRLSLATRPTHLPPHTHTQTYTPPSPIHNVALEFTMRIFAQYLIQLFLNTSILKQIRSVIASFLCRFN